MKTLDINNPFAAGVFYEETVSTTMDVARALAASGEPHGTAITTDFQEVARARFKRPWSGERGQSLLFTILLRYDSAARIPQALPLKAGLAVSLAVEDVAPILSGRVMVKWPNDVMICSAVKSGGTDEGRKAAGILVEADGATVYIGIGVNVAQRNFPPEFRAKAGSIIEAAGELPDGARFTLLEKILARLHRELEPPADAPAAGKIPAADYYAAPWQQRLGQRLYKKAERVIFAPGAADTDCLVEGTISGLGAAGELLIIPAGEQTAQAFVTGELRVY